MVICGYTWFGYKWLTTPKGAKVCPDSGRRHSKRVDHKGQLAPHCRALGAMITKIYHGIEKAVYLFRFNNFKHLLGSGGTTI